MPNAKAGHGSPADALRARNAGDPCADYFKYRTQQVFIRNPTSWTINIAFKQVTSRYEVPEGFVADTGVFVACTNSGPKVDCLSDPCSAGGSRAPIIGTNAKCSAEFVKAGQNPVQINFPERIAEPDKYFLRVGWAVTESAATADGESTLTIEDISVQADRPKELTRKTEKSK